MGENATRGEPLTAISLLSRCERPSTGISQSTPRPSGGPEIPGSNPGIPTHKALGQTRYAPSDAPQTLPWGRIGDACRAGSTSSASQLPLLVGFYGLVDQFGEADRGVALQRWDGV